MSASATPVEQADTADDVTDRPLKPVRGPGKKQKKLVVNVRKVEPDGTVTRQLVHLHSSSRPQTGDPRGLAQVAQPTGNRKRARTLPVPATAPAPLNDDSDLDSRGATLVEKDQGPNAWESYLQELHATDPGMTTMRSTAPRACRARALN